LRLTSKHLLLLAKKNNLTYPRLGLAISKKRASLAISRNHIKRQAREVFRQHQHEIGGYDFVFLLRKNIDKTASKTIREEYLSIYKQFLANQSYGCETASIFPRLTGQKHANTKNFIVCFN